ncbi:MAG: serine/threonine protein kinase [Sandaracinaceae bacterium]|nr:serine/threonine protein kinase [Sandaracinaceae bacterium]MDW8246397.1 serine/threonine-protein kinase [Sandaracinaceae bacterium]
MSVVPHRIGNYILHERIGIGGMAEVYRASIRGPEGFERMVAIKRILPNLVSDEDFVRMFIDEAKLAVKLQHPNIVSIIDLAREGDELFIAMEYVHGKDLRAVLDRVQSMEETGRRMPIEYTAYVVARICEALHHAYFSSGPGGEPLRIIHRDISPQNVLLSFEGEVKVTDFGLAKAAGRASYTRAGVVKGKLAYMSPEQIRGQPLDHRSDVYATGILLWEMLTGTRLFLAPTDQETILRVYHAQVPPPRTIRPDIPEELEAIAMKALAKRPEDRYESAEAMQEDITAWLYSLSRPVRTSTIGTFMRWLFPEANRSPSSRPPPSSGAHLGLISSASLSSGLIEEIEAIEEELIVEEELSPSDEREEAESPSKAEGAQDGEEAQKGRRSSSGRLPIKNWINEVLSNRDNQGSPSAAPADGVPPFSRRK